MAKQKINVKEEPLLLENAGILQLKAELKKKEYMIDELEKSCKSQRQKNQEKNKELLEGVYKYINGAFYSIFTFFGVLFVFNGFFNVNEFVAMIYGLFICIPVFLGIYSALEKENGK